MMYGVAPLALQCHCDWPERQSTECALWAIFVTRLDGFTVAPNSLLTAERVYQLA